VNCTSKDTIIIKHITFTENGSVRQLSVLSIGPVSDGVRGHSAMDDLHAAIRSLGLVSQASAAATPHNLKESKAVAPLPAPKGHTQPEGGEPLTWTPQQIARLEAMAEEANAEDRERDAKGLPTRVPREIWDRPNASAVTPPGD